MVRAVGSQWQRATEDFTPTNQNGAFWHSHRVRCHDEGGLDQEKGGRVACFHATKPWRDFPAKQRRFAEVCEDEDEMWTIS